MKTFICLDPNKRFINPKKEKIFVKSTKFLSETLYSILIQKIRPNKIK